LTAFFFEQNICTVYRRYGKTRKYNQRKSTRGKTPKKKNKMRQKGSGRSRTSDGKRRN